jgi:transposase
MEAISMDLRERVAAAYDRGEGTSTQLAQRFAVSASWVRGLLRRRRETGSLAPTEYKPGPQRKLTPEQRDRLIELAAEEPDATLEELRRRLRLKVAISTVWRELNEAGFTRKKSRSRPASKSGPTSRLSAASGKSG